jgi:hypothetical protein
MKLTEFNLKKSTLATKALNEQYSVKLDLTKMSLSETRTMLSKVRNLIQETRETGTNQTSPSYMKLVFMEQALGHHYGELKAMPMYSSRIVVENEEVEKSQVVLAAQDMVDSVQKMVEEVSDMLVKELPALTDSVNSEIGTNEGEQFSAQTSEALGTLAAALTQAKTQLQGALNTITGQGGAGAFDTGPDMAPPMGDEMTPDMGDDMGGEEEIDLDDELPEEPPEMEPTADLGRGKR